MLKRCSGFTLVELTAFAVILGVMAATLVPRFVQFETENAQAVVDGIARDIESGASLNHARNIASDTGLISEQATAVSTCTHASRLLKGGLHSDYLVSPGNGKAIANKGVDTEGGISVCLVRYDANGNGVYDATDLPKAEFSLYGVQ